MYRLLVCLVLAATVSPAAACINDSELPNHEREFRSQYRGSPAPPPAAASPEPAGRPSARLLVVGGGVLLTAAFALTFVGRRARN